MKAAKVQSQQPRPWIRKLTETTRPTRGWELPDHVTGQLSHSPDGQCRAPAGACGSPPWLLRRRIESPRCSLTRRLIGRIYHIASTATLSLSPRPKQDKSKQRQKPVLGAAGWIQGLRPELAVLSHAHWRNTHQHRSGGNVRQWPRRWWPLGGLAGAALLYRLNAV